MWLGVTMMSVDYNPAMRCLEIVREVNPRIVTMVGGPHPTIMPQELLDNPDVDHIFLGEGEETFPAGAGHAGARRDAGRGSSPARIPTWTASPTPTTTCSSTNGARRATQSTRPRRPLWRNCRRPL